MSRLLIVIGSAALLLGAPPVHAATPADRYQENAANDTVTDTRTGITWQRTVSPGSYTWPAANAYCAGLGTGWRVPTLKELLTLVDPARHDPAIAPVFRDTPPMIFWTATRNVHDKALWCVSFSLGYTSTYSDTNTLRVRCVR